MSSEDTRPDPVPPSHGEPGNVGARPGMTCPCGYPIGRLPELRLDCPHCGRPYDNEEDE